MALGVVGPQTVDAEVRRRLAGVREAAPPPRVAEGPRPLRVFVRRVAELVVQKKKIVPQKHLPS
jgi:hypothetical protein